LTGFRYPVAALRADYGRAAAGFALTAGPLAFAFPTPAVRYVLATFAGLFGLYALRTVRRQLTRFELSESGLRAIGPLGSSLRWEDLRDVELRYFSTRRDRSRGWMQLRVRGRGRALALDSGLAGFDAIARYALAEAHARDVAVSQTTHTNFSALPNLEHGVPDRPGGR
jgi:hypothetical protein